MFELTDGTIRAYRKKNGQLSLNYKSFLVINTNTGFSLCHYLDTYSCTLENKYIGKIDSEKITLTVHSEFYDDDIMVHEIWVKFLVPEEIEVPDCIANLSLMLKLSFSDDNEYINKKVVLKKIYQ